MKYYLAHAHFVQDAKLLINYENKDGFCTFANGFTLDYKRPMGDKVKKTFQFKQFCIKSGETSMSVGTDGVLLGAWAEIPPHTKSIIDIGTGSGVISLMLAQRCPNARITGIDINDDAVKTARENAEKSPFASNTIYLCADIRKIAPSMKYDLIVSNPPFFPKGCLVKGSSRSMARSFETLTPQQLIECADRIINPNGSLAVIIPSSIADDFEYWAWEKDFRPTHCTDIVTVHGKKPKRRLMQFVKNYRTIKKCVDDTLTLQLADGSKTEEYLSLTKDFYIDKT